MEKTWKPTVIGILNIVSGAFGIVGFAIAIIAILIVIPVGGNNLAIRESALCLVIVVPVLIAVALAITSGIYALKRKKWGWVLAGSIAALFLSWPLAIAAIVLTVMSEKEFEKLE